MNEYITHIKIKAIRVGDRKEFKVLEIHFDSRTVTVKTKRGGDIIPFDLEFHKNFKKATEEEKKFREECVELYFETSSGYTRLILSN